MAKLHLKYRPYIHNNVYMSITIHFESDEYPKCLCMPGGLRGVVVREWISRSNLKIIKTSEWEGEISDELGMIMYNLCLNVDRWMCDYDKKWARFPMNKRKIQAATDADLMNICSTYIIANNLLEDIMEVRRSKITGYITFKYYTPNTWLFGDDERRYTLPLGNKRNIFNTIIRKKSKPLKGVDRRYLYYELSDRYCSVLKGLCRHRGRFPIKLSFNASDAEIDEVVDMCEVYLIANSL